MRRTYALMLTYLLHKAKPLLIASRAPRKMHFRHDTRKVYPYMCVYVCIWMYVASVCTYKCVIKAKRTKGVDATMESRAPMEKV